MHLWQKNTNMRAWLFTILRTSNNSKILFREHEEDGHGDHEGYIDETLKHAIIRGVDAGGKSLDQDMPRWFMSKQDLDDLIAF